MTAAPALPLPLPPAAVAADAAVLSRYGDVLLDALTPRVPGTGAVDGDPRTGLVDALSRLALALQAHDPARLRRQTGWWGRLLGRDVEQQADADALQAQLGVVLFNAQAHAQSLHALIAASEQAVSVDQHAAQALDQWADAGGALQATLPGEATGPLHAALQQRVAHLRLLAAMKRIAAAEAALVQAQDAALLAHLQRITDTLLPAWRQAVASGQVQAQARQQGQAARLLAQIRDEVASAQARLP
ncbi:hypothetical protein [Stenotrophomonas sp.]|uniref:hypothetical protein n=1 Tax=Stenotrophomonas sp. TaxID=69392 RepID=UPI002FCAC1E0